ncbi:transmembrane protein 156 [Monodelphis domestica]|uniref:transmembrane protein 156 n=1 Tax=Monodelphis domestica TaxID=13616 RepID=UPI0024E1B1A9|nr:transmembrane protein 156 [Monodelphis domestica]
MCLNMTKPALLKLLVVIMIMFILILPEYFKTSKVYINTTLPVFVDSKGFFFLFFFNAGNIVELSCFDLSSLNNFTYPLPEFNISFVSFLQQEREREVIVLGISADHFPFHNISQVCPLTPSELQLYSSCLVCESKGNLDFIHQELTTKGNGKLKEAWKMERKLLGGKLSLKLDTLGHGIKCQSARDLTIQLLILGWNLTIGAYFKGSVTSIMNESVEMKVKHFPLLPVLFNFTLVPAMEDLGGHATTCFLKLSVRNSSTRRDSAMESSVQSLNSCRQVSLQLEMEIGTLESFYCTFKNVCFLPPLTDSICIMRITWYVLVLSVFIFLIIFIVHKIFQEKRRVQIWKNQTYESASIFLKGNDSEKWRGMLNTPVVSGATKERRSSAFTGATERLPPISELEHFSTVNGEDQYTQLPF